MTAVEPLGRRREVRLEQGPIRFYERGTGEPVLFLHGLLVNATLWRKVIPLLAHEHRCIAPDLPLGAHHVPLDDHADLTPVGLARLVADLTRALELEGATIVANDTGGAIAQVLATHHPERAGRLVLTPCDAFDNFLPPLFRYLQWLSRIPGAGLLLAGALRILLVDGLQRLPPAFGWVTKRPLERGTLAAYVRPLGRDRGVRRDLIKVLRGISTDYTQEAARGLPSFDRPALVAWATEDRVFPPEHGRRLAGLLPDARLEWIDDSYSFVPEDRPERLAMLIAELIGRSAGASSLPPAGSKGA